MLMDSERFEVLAAVEDTAEEIARECLVLPRSAYVEWPDRGAYTGTWLTCPLKLRTYPEALHVDLEVNRARCPRTTALLERFPRVFAAGFSWMEPRCHILPHVDLKEPDVLRAHLGIQVDEYSHLRVAGDLHHWEQGRTLIFDALVDHETANLGERRRIVLMFDFHLTLEELAYAQAFNDTVDPRFFRPASVRIPFEQLRVVGGAGCSEAGRTAR